MENLPVVNLGYQVHQASTYDNDSQLYKFSNIPYADPPVGELRFRAPRSPSWRQTSVQRGLIAKICPQSSPRWQSAFSLPEFNISSFTEDCLVLDVIVPKLAFDNASIVEQGELVGASVLVWIHGGAFVYGHKEMFGSPERIIAASQGDGSPGIIWVAINYRLGAFGWLGGPTLQTDGTANAGFYDQRLAIAWVRDHIAKFGGDGQSITIMGESAGGASVMHQICAFGGEKGVTFQRAIAQSPGFRPIVDKQTQEARLRDFLALLSVESLEEARLLPSARLIEANSQMIKRAEYGSYGFGPVIGDGFVPADPCLLFLQDRYAINVTVMSSFTSDEGAMFNDPSVTTETKFRARVHHYYSELSMEELDAMILSLYPPVYDGSRGYTSLSQRYKLVLSELLFTSNHNAMLQAAMRNGRDAFGYCFSIPPAIHGSDLSYTFHPSMGEVLSRHTAELIQAAIASFTKTGNPNATGTDTTFPVYDSRALMLDLNLATSVIKDPSDNDRCAFQQTAFTRRND